MNLKEWILRNIEMFGPLHIWIKTGIVDNSDYQTDNFITGNSRLIRYEEEYKDVISEYGDTGFYACVPLNKLSPYYYFLWDEIGCYTFKVIDSISEEFFTTRLWGNKNWRTLLENEFGDLFNRCIECACFNDYVVTGWCTIEEGIHFCRGFVGKI